MDMKNMNEKIILVTGGCGYIGSRLIRDITADEHLGVSIVRVLDNFQSGHYRALLNLPEDGRYQFLEGDILDPLAMELALQEVDTVIHLAAIVRTPMSFDRPAWVEQVNHWGTAQLVEACLKAGVNRLIFTSSASVYGPGGVFSEDDICRPIGPYAQSKYKAESSVLAAIDRGLHATVIRLGTVYGLAPVTRFDAVANRFAFLAGVGRALTVLGSGHQRRPLIHIKDATNAIMFCMSHPEETSEVVLNVTGENPSVIDLADVIHSLKPDVSVHYTEQDIHTHISFEVSSDKFKSFGWQPKLTIRDGIAEILTNFTNLEKFTLYKSYPDVA
jgi:UDP-glucose 4-epimerase